MKFVKPVPPEKQRKRVQPRDIISGESPGSTTVRNFNKRWGTAEVVNDGSTSTVATVAHNLGFTPKVEAFLNDATISGIGSGLTIPLPTFLSATIDTVTPAVTFTVYLYCTPDDTSLHFHMLNSTGVARTVTVTYALSRESSSRG